MELDESELDVLRARPGWDVAVRALGALYAEHGDRARSDANEMATRYRGRRALSVVDVVASRQRRYRTVVRRMLDSFATSRGGDLTLRGLATRSPGDVLKLRHRQDEAATMQAVAEALLRYGDDHGLDDDDAICTQWAQAVAAVSIAPRVDPYVGSVAGIGPALFAYLRMQSGADALKPDVQTRAALNQLGFEPPRGEVAVLVLASGAAHEVDGGIPLAVLDQLLWWATQ